MALHSSAALAAKPHARSSGKSHAVEKKAAERKKVYLPADLWVRIRQGLVLPKPVPVVLPPAPVPPIPDLEPAQPAPPAAKPRIAKVPKSLDLRWIPNISTEPSRNPQSGRPDESKEEPAGYAELPPVEVAELEAEKPFEERQREYEAQLEKYELLKAKAAAYTRYSNQINWVLQRPSFVQQSLERARPYLYLVVEELEKRKIPMDLVLLPIMESGFKARAESKKAAGGIWQFIHSTGKAFGLPQVEGYDGRFDIAESSRAAASYLSNLRQRFHGDWLLALASYNCGEGRVEQAIAANRAAGLPTDFWSLQLPEETKAYVPRLLALSEVFSNPHGYKLSPKPVHNRPYLERIALDRILPVEKAAMLSNLDKDTFLTLNPGFTGNMIGLDASHDLLLPKQNARFFHRNLQLYLHPPKEPVAPVFELTGSLPGFVHTAYRLPIAEGDSLNGRPDKPRIQGIAAPEYGPAARQDAADQTIFTDAGPIAKLSLRQTIDKPAVAANSLPPEIIYLHTVSAGETVEKIAEYYDADPELIRSMNKLKPNKRLEPGKQLKIQLDSPEQGDSDAAIQPRPVVRLADPPAGANASL